METSITVSTTAVSHPVGASAPGFYPPMTGYEFELNHEGNLRELRRQKQWAQAQLWSCNENNRFQHTQTTACVVAVNGHLIGPYRSESLRCYGTNPEIAGLRVTMTVYEGDNSGNSKQREERVSDDDYDADGSDNAELPVFRGATLVLRHQIIVAHPRNHHHQQSHQHQPPPYVLPATSCTTSMSSLMASLSQLPGADNNSSSLASRTRTNTGQSIESTAGTTGTGSTAGSSSFRYGTASTMTTTATTPQPSHQQGRRYLFATTIIPLHAGVAARPGYRPVEASAAAERIRQWGGLPDKGVFGNAWLVHMAVEPGHVQHAVDNKMMEQVARLTGTRSGGGVSGGGSTDMATATMVGGVTAVQTMRMVNENMAQLAAREGTLSVLLSNHITQKRIARQCPDLVAMWVMAQENL